MAQDYEVTLKIIVYADSVDYAKKIAIERIFKPENYVTPPVYSIDAIPVNKLTVTPNVKKPT